MHKTNIKICGREHFDLAVFGDSRREVKRGGIYRIEKVGQRSPLQKRD